MEQNSALPETRCMCVAGQTQCNFQPGHNVRCRAWKPGMSKTQNRPFFRHIVKMPSAQFQLKGKPHILNIAYTLEAVVWK